MKKKYNIAVIGATSLIGRQVLQLLWETEFPYDNVYAVAPEKMLGQEVSFGEDEVLKVNNIESFDFSKVDIVIASSIKKIYSLKYSQIARAFGVIWIDNSNAFLNSEEKATILIPDINSHAIDNVGMGGIIINPNHNIVQLTKTIASLNYEKLLVSLNVTSLYPTSSFGKDGLDELFDQTRGIYANDPSHKYQEIFTKQIAFNLIPHVSNFTDNGYTEEELQTMIIPQKILNREFKTSATSVITPVFIGNSQVIEAEFEQSIKENEIAKIIKKIPGISIIDYRENNGYVTPVETVNEDNIFISRIRIHPNDARKISFWSTCDNLHTSSALNMVKIAELIIKKKKI